MTNPSEQPGMQQALQIVSGFFFGVGLILASALMKALLHMGLCG